MQDQITPKTAMVSSSGLFMLANAAVSSDGTNKIPSLVAGAVNDSSLDAHKGREASITNIGEPHTEVTSTDPEMQHTGTLPPPLSLLEPDFWSIPLSFDDILIGPSSSSEWDISAAPPDGVVGGETFWNLTNSHDITSFSAQTSSVPTLARTPSLWMDLEIEDKSSGLEGCDDGDTSSSSDTEDDDASHRGENLPNRQARDKPPSRRSARDANKRMKSVFNRKANAAQAGESTDAARSSAGRPRTPRVRTEDSSDDANMRCTSGHPFETYRVSTKATVVCDTCQMRVETQCIAYGCRQCDVDMCSSCKAVQLQQLKPSRILFADTIPAQSRRSPAVTAVNVIRATSSPAMQVPNMTVRIGNLRTRVAYAVAALRLKNDTSLSARSLDSELIDNIFRLSHNSRRDTAQKDEATLSASTTCVSTFGLLLDMDDSERTRGFLNQLCESFDGAKAMQAGRELGYKLLNLSSTSRLHRSKSVRRMLYVVESIATVLTVNLCDDIAVGLVEQLENFIKLGHLETKLDVADNAYYLVVAIRALFPSSQKLGHGARDRPEGQLFRYRSAIGTLICESQSRASRGGDENGLLNIKLLTL